MSSGWLPLRLANPKGSQLAGAGSAPAAKASGALRCAFAGGVWSPGKAWTSRTNNLRGIYDLFYCI